MKISNNYAFGLYKSNNPQLHTNSINRNNSQMNDVFEKSKVSFGSSKDDFSGGFLIGFAFDLFDALSSVFAQQKKEIIMSGVLEALTTPQVRNLLKAQKNMKIENLTSGLFSNFGSQDDYYNDIFKEAGINTFFHLELFLRKYTQNPNTKKIFFAQGIEAVKIYGLLNTKDDFSKFGELLLYIYNNEEDNENPNFDKLNTTIEFLKKIGLSDFKDFSVKFAHLKDKFNDFESIADKMDAISYLEQTYNEKIKFLNDISQVKSNNKTFNAQKVYTEINDIVDYLYDNNNGESLEPLENFIDIASNTNKIKNSVFKNLSEYCNGFATPEDKIDFYELLISCDVSISDLNSLIGKSYITDSELLSNIINLQPISAEISSIKGINKSDAKAIYIKYKDFYDALYNSAQSSNNIKILTDIIDRFDIKNSEMLMNFYKNATGSNSKKLTSDEFTEFIKLFEYSDSKTILTDAKAQNTTAVEILKREKEQFEKVEEKIIEFTISDETASFAGKSAIEIYKEYKDLINENPEEVYEILSNITRFNASNSDEYKQKSAEIKKFSPYFTNNENLIKFINANAVKLDSDSQSSEYRQNCIEILESINDSGSYLNAQQIIQYLTDNSFLANSQSLIAEFLNEIPNKNERNKLLEAIALKEIPSLNALKSFIEKYKSEDGSYSNVIDHLINSPKKINFNEYIAILSNIQDRINLVNIPVTINNDNILSLDISKINAKTRISDDILCLLLEDIFNSDKYGTNFIPQLPKALVTKQNSYSKFRIAREIVDKINKSDESYSNISRLFGLDRESLKIDSNYSDYMYVKAVEKVLPQQFIDFVNSDEWLKKPNGSAKSLNISLHAKLRAIDRFILSDSQNIQDLYTEKSINKLRSLFKSVYTLKPFNLRGSDESKRIIADFNYNGEVIEAVFSKQGEMITIVPKTWS